MWRREWREEGEGGVLLRTSFEEGNISFEGGERGGEDQWDSFLNGLIACITLQSWVIVFVPLQILNRHMYFCKGENFCKYFFGVGKRNNHKSLYFIIVTIFALTGLGLAHN